MSRTGWTVTASSDQKEVSYAIDGDPMSRWNTGIFQAPGMWFKIDMQQPQLFFSVVLDTQNAPTDGPVLFDVYLSNDGNFSMPTKVGLQGSALTTIDFGSAQLVRYVYAHGLVYSVAHYFEQSGDLVADPEMELLRDESGSWFPASISMALGGKRALLLGENGRARVDEREYRSQLRFLLTWMKNIRSQQRL